MKPDIIVVGAGFAGAVLAERFATQQNKKVLVLEKRAHIGGNMYDYCDENGVQRHEYGPHIFHTNNKTVLDYLSQFTSWYDYEHCVLGMIDGKEVPIPFNLTSIGKCFDSEKAERLKKALLESYNKEEKVPILKLRKNENKEVQELANFIYEKVFKHYTMKQWGLTPEEIDPAVTERVPVLIGTDARYFQDQYQCMPTHGYTAIFKKMLEHENIEVRLNCEAKDYLKVDPVAQCIMVDGEKIKIPVIYTGALDDLMEYSLGALPYRSLEFDVQTHLGTYQQAATINYPTPKSEHAFTRITEYKLLMKDYPKEKTTIAVEYPMVYTPGGEIGNVPYYPIFTNENQAKYKAYCDLVKPISNLYLLGRLAEYKYYNMDAIIERALMLFDEIK
ncbi:MAG: UDP-galactopyranose mutase [Anaerorhabdus sp.]